MLTPVGEHELLVFWIQLVVLLATARGLGGLMQRYGQPAVIGELGAGLILGPSIFGRLAPDLAGWLFPGGEVESALLLSVAWLGIVLLLMVTGFETDLRLLAELGRSSLAVSVGSLVVPMAAGFGLGLVLPESYLGDGGGRVVFAMFLAVALSISALPVVAKILQDMRLMRRDFGQITVAAGMVNDLVGWLLLGTLISLVHTGGFDAGRLGFTVVAVVAFVALSLTAGQRGVDAALRRARQAGDGFAGPFTVTVLVVLAAGAMTHALGMEAVIGAFVAGIIVGRSRYQRDSVRHALENVTHTVFAPVFFATAGLYVDLGTLFTPANALAALAVLAVAAITKVVGSYVGGLMSGLSRLESLATGIGLNARGAMEIVLASIGLRLGVLNQGSYTAVVLMAMATSMLAPPLLRPVLARLEARPEESLRLEREELLAGSIIAKARTALLPTRGGANSRLAGRVLDLLLQPEANVTILTVTQTTEDNRHERLDEELGGYFRDHAVDVRHHVNEEDVPGDILNESRLGYDLLAVGLNEEFRGSHRLSDTLRQVLSGTRVPVLLVRRPARELTDEQLAGLTFERLLVPVTGTQVGLAAEEVAYVIASKTRARVDAVHVLSRTDALATGPAATQLTRTRSLARRFGHGATPVLRRSPVAYEELLTTSRERDSDLIVLGAQLRSHDGRPFLGHGTEFLLEHADCTVVTVVFPPEDGTS